MEWYNVELHTHTLASDGNMNPDQLVDKAIARRYDAICLTDHNTTSNVEKIKEIAKNNNFKVFGGIEWTTFWGHIVVTGMKSHIDWRSVNLENIDEKITEAHDLGDIVTIAHPKRLGSPFCCGCHFDYKVNALDKVDAYEIWTKFEPCTNPGCDLAQKEWLSYIDRGYKIAPVYGYDWHNEDDSSPAYALTYVGVNGELTEESLVKAIKNRNTYVTMGIKVDCKMECGKTTYNPGDIISHKKGVLKINLEKVKHYNYDVVVKSVKVYKDNQLEVAQKWHDEEIDFDLNFDCKNVRVEIFGELNNTACRIAILSPFYMK